MAEVTLQRIDDVANPDWDAAQSEACKDMQEMPRGGPSCGRFQHRLTRPSDGSAWGRAHE